jgi:hypothetical protein
MGKLFSSPKVTPTPRMPDMTDADIQAAEQRTRRAALSRSGRDSTILTQSTGGGSGGSTAYGNTLLGQS